MAKTKLISVDKKRCQCVIIGGSFMTLGPRPRERCKNKPRWIATEKKPNPKDGQRGSMSLCDGCKKQCIKQLGRNYATFTKI